MLEEIEGGGNRGRLRNAGHVHTYNNIVMLNFTHSKDIGVVLLTESPQLKIP